MNYMKTAVKASREAEKIVMSYFNKDKHIQKKGQIDLVTKADFEAEKMIVSIIKKHYPNHGFILEEQDSFNTNAEYVWIIDPIDGTTSYAKNYPMFSISIALHKNNSPTLGVVNIPYLRELFTGEKGKGAFLNNKRISVSDTEKIEDSLISTGFPYNRLESDQDNLNYFNKVTKKCLGIRRSGSAAIDICYVAAGRSDGYWEHSLKIMDTAGAQVILEEAGGKFTNFQGNKIKKDYSKIVSTNGKIHETLIKILEEAE